MVLRKGGADQLTAERTRGSEVLGAQVVLLFAGDIGLDCHHLRRERIVVVLLVQLCWVFQVHLEDEIRYLIEYPMIK